MRLHMRRTALIYDFDGTLARGNMQERSFIPEIGMTRETFWREVKTMAERNDADEILVYMHLMIEKSKEKRIEVSRSVLRDHGENPDLFRGLDDESWFDRIDIHARNHGLSVEHYIVSSGIEEMIHGCSIARRFRRVYASKFIYRDEIVAWPGVAINYTTKTQYLFRINKGINNHWDNGAINQFMAEEDRPIPFARMIFIGDGATDIPAMKMTIHQGGCAIAVYDPDRGDHDLSKIHQLIADGRVDFVAPADYSEDSQMDIIVKGILSRIARWTTGAGSAWQEHPGCRAPVGDGRPQPGCGSTSTAQPRPSDTDPARMD